MNSRRSASTGPDAAAADGEPGDTDRRRPRLRALAAEILADGEQLRYWAEHCRWFPGTGICVARAGCPAQCVFRQRREAEAERLRQARRIRRSRPIDD